MRIYSNDDYSYPEKFAGYGRAFDSVPHMKM